MKIKNVWSDNNYKKVTSIVYKITPKLVLMKKKSAPSLLLILFVCFPFINAHSQGFDHLNLTTEFISDMQTIIETDSLNNNCLHKTPPTFEVTLTGAGSGTKNVYGQNFTQHMNYNLTVDFTFLAHSPVTYGDLTIYSIQIIYGNVHHWGTAVDYFYGHTTTLNFDYTHIYQYFFHQGILEFSNSENEIVYIGIQLPYSSTSNKFTPYYLQFVDPNIVPVHIMNFSFWMFNHEYIIEGAASGLEAPDQFTSELHWIDNSESNPVGVCSDGSSAIILRILHEMGNSPINQIRIQLTDGTGTNIHPLGTIGTSIGNATGSNLTVNNPPGNDYWDFYYVAPEVFSNNGYSHPEREVVALIEVDCQENGMIQTYEFSQSINIIRPPVLLIHGLRSNMNCFMELNFDLISSGRYFYNSVRLIDYYSTNDHAFDTNIKVIPNEIEQVKSTFRSVFQIEVCKVDLVGHSMGGILSRLYLQSQSYKNDVNKLITVNTPHSGSQGANLIWALPELLRKMIGFNGCAVNDLRVDSDAICHLLNGDNNLNANIVPSHSINTTVLDFAPFYPIFKENLFAVALLIAARIKFPFVSNLIELFPALIFGEPNDLVVPVGSQIGGLGAYAYTSITNEWHNGAPNNIFVRNRILELLESSPSSSLFSSSGFNPPQCPKGFNQELILDSISFSSDSVFFLAPTPGTTIANGQSVFVDIEASSGIHNLIFYAKTSQDSVFFLDTLASALTVNYTVPQTAYGKIEMFVIGVDSIGNVAIDTTYIDIQVNATPISIFITYPTDSLVLSQGFYGSVYVSCLFSDNVVREITNSPQVQYSLKTNKAEYVSQGVIKGVQQGLDTLVIDYHNHTLHLPVYVGQFYVQTDTVFVNDSFCYGDSYVFYDQILTEPGVYDMTFTNIYGGDSLIILNLSMLSIPPAPDKIFGPNTVYQGQTEVVYYIEHLDYASLYQWTLPPGMQGSSITNSINVNLKPNAYSGYLSVFGYNDCGEGIADSLYINVEMADHLNLNNNTVYPVDSICFNAIESIILAGEGGWFVVEHGGSVELVAGQNISMLPGTSVQQGGYLLARIAEHVDDYCGINEAFEITKEPVTSKEDVVSADLPYEIRKNSFFTLYPNPTDGTFTLELTTADLKQNITVEVFTMLGGRLFSKELPPQRLHILSLEGQQAGMYIIRVMKGDQLVVERLIKR